MELVCRGGGIYTASFSTSTLFRVRMVMLIRCLFINLISNKLRSLLSPYMSIRLLLPEKRSVDLHLNAVQKVDQRTVVSFLDEYAIHVYAWLQDHHDH